MRIKSAVSLMMAFSLMTALHADEKKFKRKHRTGLRISAPKELTGPKSFSCYPNGAKPAEKDEFSFSIKLEDAEKCKVGLDSIMVAGESKSAKTVDGKLVGNCQFGQVVHFDFGPECKVTIDPIVEAK